FAVDAEPLQHLDRGLRLHVSDSERVDDEERAVLHLLGERRAQGAACDLLRQLEVIAARGRTKHGATMPPNRVPDRADAGAAGALLPPRLLAAAADERAVLRHVRAATVLGVGVNDRFPDQIAIHTPAEHIVAHVDAADFFVLAV